LGNNTRNAPSSSSIPKSLDDTNSFSQEVEPIIKTNKDQSLSYTLIRPTTVEISAKKKLLLIDLLLNNKNLINNNHNSSSSSSLSGEDDEQDKSLVLNDLNLNRNSNEIRIDYEGKALNESDSEKDASESDSLVEDSKSSSNIITFKFRRELILLVFLKGILFLI